MKIGSFVRVESDVESEYEIISHGDDGRIGIIFESVSSEYAWVFWITKGIFSKSLSEQEPVSFVPFSYLEEVESPKDIDWETICKNIRKLDNQIWTKSITRKAS